MSSNLDIRIVKLAKWEIPKSKSVFEYCEESSLAIGYFDMIDVEKVEYEKEKALHPLSVAYDKLHRVRSEKEKVLENYSIQELIVFADYHEAIEPFWSKESLLMFISMLHVDNERDINEVISEIDTIFKGIDYLWYFSFDYSGIILFAKNITIKEYLRKMFQLNYGYVSREKLIRDSYSLYGFHKKSLQKYFEEFRKGDYSCKGVSEEKEFSISVNIGVQNYNVYKSFVKELRKMKDTEIKEYNLLGRHDVSIVNENANLKWLLYVQYLINEFTHIESKEESNKEETLFSTYETFVKIKSDDLNLSDTDAIHVNHFYQYAEKQLNNICNEFCEKISKNETVYNGEYKAPVQAVQHSILSILKNRYAEDFILCMYQSFFEFLNYLSKQITQAEEGEKPCEENAAEFESCFDQYFQGLNSLVNSAMHSERQFIQVTSFNAVIYDVPAKIMAFYVAIIHAMQKIIKSVQDKRYTFLLTPSFHDEISVKVISYYPSLGEIPQDRILQVKINEKSLYNPGAVIRRMAHEIAHFAGDELRCRAQRKRHLKYSLIHVILRQILYKSFIEEEEYNELAENIYCQFQKSSVFANGKNNYSKNLEHLAPEILLEFRKNENIQSLIFKYVEYILKKYLFVTGEENRKKCTEIKWFIKEISWYKRGAVNELINAFLEQKSCGEREIDILTRIILEDINCELDYLLVDKRRIAETHLINKSAISKLGNGPLNKKTLRAYADGLISSYKESFADLQMILLTGIEYFEYLNGFIKEENLDLHDFANSINDISRIAMVTLVLDGIGIWNIYDNDERFFLNTQLQEFHKRVLTQIENLWRSVEVDELIIVFDNLRDKAENFLKADKKEYKKSSRHIETCTEDRKQEILDLTHLQLVHYLTLCTNKSLEHYGTFKNMNGIKELRRTINNVVQCSDVKIMFQTICQEIEKYKEILQHEENY